MSPKTYFQELIWFHVGITDFFINVFQEEKSFPNLAAFDLYFKPNEDLISTFQLFMIYRTRTEIWSQNVISILDLKLVVKLLPNHS